MLHFHSPSDSQRVVFLVRVSAINALSCPNSKGFMPTTSSAPFKLEISNSGESKALWKKIDAIREFNKTPKTDEKGNPKLNTAGKQIITTPQGRSVLNAIIKAVLEDAPSELVEELSTYVKPENGKKFIAAIPEARAKAELKDINKDEVKNAVKHFSDAEWDELVAARKAQK